MRMVACAFTLVLITAASSVSAGEQADLGRWLEEWAEIRCNPALSDPVSWIAEAQKTQYAEAARKGNIVTPLMLERIAKNAKDGAEAEKWARISRDNKVADVLREQAAGDARAQTLLCDIHLGGLAGVGVDAARAVEWLRNVAEQGFPLAQNSLGEMYQWGRNGLGRDPERAAGWYRKAAEQDFAFAQSNLAVMYQTGRGVAKDETRAAAWYAKAAAQGYPGGISALERLAEGNKPARPKGYASMRNAANHEIGKIFPGGEVRDEKNQKIGMIMADGEVRNGRNHGIGRLMPDGEVRSANNRKMGQVMPDGEVRNAANHKIGRLMADGEVRDEKNRKIGKTGDLEIAKEWSAAFFFFFPGLFSH